MNKNVVIGVASGIAAYKTLDLIKLLKKEGVNCIVVMTKAATQMVNPSEFKRATGNKVYTELFEKDFNYKKILKLQKVDHIDLADKADVFVIAPATANTIAKIANGFADDFLTTTLLAATCPVIICPSMNPNMYNNPTVVENLSKLRKLGYIIIKPASGMLACGYEGIGRLADLENIKVEIMKQLDKTNSLTSKRILITAGGTREKIDDVRYITNSSSGKMGAALADECYLRGADITIYKSASSVNPRYLIKSEIFETKDDLESLIKSNVKNFDVVIQCAAVSDFIPEKKVGKIASTKSQTLILRPHTKIIDTIKKLNPKVKLVAFKAYWEKTAHELIDKSDATIFNDISKKDVGLESDYNEVEVVTKDSVEKITKAPKAEIAKKIIDFLVVQKILT
ncbi:MAG TPA: bifunctional phosphopantothenoylcysteine decarboxylase/phosphopantothenate--cysteine ligase CoaBC [Candidatus Saccharimonadales bacterium]|nr:bifunctional phosphopantothenoylcysteine decarboxylase/phosphopantothenate--cysteine ligase CoaBC [Candidatus Saccharimonadales bacterium]